MVVELSVASVAARSPTTSAAPLWVNTSIVPSSRSTVRMPIFSAISPSASRRWSASSLGELPSACAVAIDWFSSATRPSNGFRSSTA